MQYICVQKEIAIQDALLSRFSQFKGEIPFLLMFFFQRKFSNKMKIFTQIEI